MTQVALYGNGNPAGVSENGEVLTRSFAYSTAAFANCTTDNTAVNLKKPEAGKQFVARGGLISGNRDIGVNGSNLVVYEANSTTSLTVINKALIDVEVPKGSIFPFLVPDVITDEGNFINAKCDDNSVRVSLYGYFVPSIPS